MNIQRFVNQPYESNTYIVHGCAGAPDIVIDPGNPDVAGLLNFLTEKAIAPDYIVLTHGHADHIAGLQPLRETFGSPVVCTRACSELIIDARKNLSLYRSGEKVECAAPEILCEDIGWRLGEGPNAIELISSPGHTPGSMCMALGGALFSGDTLIPSEKTVTKLPGGDKRQLRATIELLYARFGEGTPVYPGHGESFRLSRESLDRALGLIQ